MQIELKIKEILKDTRNVEKKVEDIKKFMNWDKEKLTEAIYKYGTAGDKQRSSIIEKFWNKNTLKDEKDIK